MPRPPTTTALFLGLALLLAAPPPASTQPVVGPRPQAVDDVFRPMPDEVRVETWVAGLEAPWSLVFLPDGRALVSERPGRIRLIEDGVLAETPYAGFDAAGGGMGGVFGAMIDLAIGGEGGLMGLAVHPDFPDAPYIYAMYTFRERGVVGNRVVRLRDEGDHAVFDRVVLDDLPGARLHNGGRIAFGPDGMLYVALGEQFQAERAVDLDHAGGKILRVTPMGRIPPDNPFRGSPVWSFGHRNPQGLAWDPETGALFASEHGPSGEFGLRAFDEINVIVPGSHHGWPDAVGAPGIESLVDPLIAWPRRATPPAGMAFHRGDLYVATLASETLLRIALERDGDTFGAAVIERWFKDEGGRGSYGRLRDVVNGPDGALYVLTSNRDGRGEPGPQDDRVLRVSPVAPALPAIGPS